MKTTIQKEVDICDRCKKEGYVNSCDSCGTDLCWDCQKTEAVKYEHAIYVSGSGDALYCKACDTTLAAKGDKRLMAYRRIKELRAEMNAFGEAFRLKQDEAERAVQKLKGKN